jgi:hypothetical protein
MPRPVFEHALRAALQGQGIVRWAYDPAMWRWLGDANSEVPAQPQETGP